MITLLLSTALAHHGTAVSNVSASPTSNSRAIDFEIPLPRITFDLGYEGLTFRTNRRGWKRYGVANTQIDIHTWTAGAGFRFNTDTGISFRLPVGFTLVVLEDGNITRPGLGDLAISVDQRWKVWTFRLDAIAPTGRYEADVAQSVVDVDPNDPDFIVIYDTRASLGAGSFALRGGVRGRWEDGIAAWRVGLFAHQPISRTPDDVWWGTTVGGTLGMDLNFFQKQLTIGIVLDGNFHAMDRLKAPDEDTGLITTYTFGSRGSFGANLAVGGRLGPGVVCGGTIRVPLAQWAYGVQLMDTLGGGVSCSFAVGTGHQSPATGE